MIAALYVDTARGAYARLPGVECWGYATKDGRQLDALAPTRDARQYAGPHPVVAHPPCGPWGRFRRRYLGGEGDRECAVVAVEQVRRFGGVLEHPAYSLLWREPGIGLCVPGDGFDSYGGFTVAINQCDWGHPATKPTWLYVVGCTLPPMPPPKAPTHVMVRLVRNGNDRPEVPKAERHITPPDLAAWLVGAAETARRSLHPAPVP